MIGSGKVIIDGNASKIMNINEKKSFDVIVIGGGAAGMMAAITAASNGADTMILEHKDLSLIHI
mgnify:CR=1 FL=1